MFVSLMLLVFVMIINIFLVMGDMLYILIDEINFVEGGKIVKVIVVIFYEFLMYLGDMKLGLFVCMNKFL